MCRLEGEVHQLYKDGSVTIGKKPAVSEVLLLSLGQDTGGEGLGIIAKPPVVKNP